MDSPNQFDWAMSEDDRVKAASGGDEASYDINAGAVLARELSGNILKTVLKRLVYPGGAHGAQRELLTYQALSAARAAGLECGIQIVNNVVHGYRLDVIISLPQGIIALPLEPYSGVEYGARGQYAEAIVHQFVME